ncbi:hypothetical protein ACFCZ3_19610 [Cellulosimicrobium cellulans]|uniref:hypothetical protein n=1 Tax=Cellulosimicrobium cellulans TaxID=1710 RepID=UPI0035E33E11
MTIPSYVDADPVALALRTLRSSERLLEAIGSLVAPSGSGPAVAEHVSGEREAPWPHVRVIPGVGGIAGHAVRGVQSVEVDVDVWDHPDQRLGKKAIRDVATIAREELVALAFADEDPPGLIVYDVKAPVPQNQTLANGHIRYFFTATFDVRPAT